MNKCKTAKPDPMNYGTSGAPGITIMTSRCTECKKAIRRVIKRKEAGKRALAKAFKQAQWQHV